MLRLNAEIVLSEDFFRDPIATLQALISAGEGTYADIAFLFLY